MPTATIAPPAGLVGDYNPAGYISGNVATYPPLPPGATLYQPGMAWHSIGTGDVDGQNVTPGDFLFATPLQRPYGALRYGDLIYGGTGTDDWIPELTRFMLWDSSLPADQQPPFPYSGCLFTRDDLPDGDWAPGWRIVIDSLFVDLTDTRTYGVDTYGSEVYGDVTGGTQRWADITQPSYSVRAVSGTRMGEDVVPVDTIEIELLDETGDWVDFPAPAFWFSPFVGDPIRVGLFDPTIKYHPIIVGEIELLADEHDGNHPRTVVIQGFGHIMDLVVDLFTWQRPAEVASYRISQLMAAAGWRFGSGDLVYPGDAALIADPEPRDVAARDEIDRTARSAGWQFDTDSWGGPRVRTWPLEPTGTPIEVTDCDVPDQPGYWIPATSAVPGYLTPTVGTVTTSDPGPLPNECCFVFKVRGPTNPSGYHGIASQWETQGNVCFQLSRAVGTTGINLTATATGVTTGGQAALVAHSTATVIADQWVAVASHFNDGTNRRTQLLDSSDGITWTARGAPNVLTSQVPFDSSSLMRIGNISSAAIGTLQGRIYSVELRTGLDPTAGTVLWRFDADDYPGTGTSYVDPRGRTWTLTTAAAITPKIPATPDVWVPPVPGPLTSHHLSFIADQAQLLNRALLANDGDPHAEIEVADTLSISRWGKRDRALGFPKTGLAFADPVAAQTIAARAVGRHSLVVRRVDQIDADTRVDHAWLPVLAALDTGQAVHVTRLGVSRYELDAVVVGFDHTITPGRIETALTTSTITPTT